MALGSPAYHPEEQLEPVMKFFLSSKLPSLYGTDLSDKHISEHGHKKLTAFDTRDVPKLFIADVTGHRLSCKTSKRQTLFGRQKTD